AFGLGCRPASSSDTVNGWRARSGGGWSRQHGKPSAKDNGKQESHPSRATHRSPPSQALRVSANATEKAKCTDNPPNIRLRLEQRQSFVCQNAAGNANV